MRRLPLMFLVIMATTAAGCSGMKTTTERAPLQENLTTESGEPAYITVQHCLISFRGTGTKAVRSQADAEKLALELFEQAQGGADFPKMIRKYTDDSSPGIYRMANTGFEGNMNLRDKIYPRDSMAAAFGDTGFPLEVGEFGLAVFDKSKSPFGWHIVKRIK
jgi:hypothetical protein